MSGKKLLLLLVLAVAVIAAALVAVGRKQKETAGNEDVSRATVPGLSEKLNAVRHLTFSRGGVQTDVYTDAEGAWHVQQLSNYPADVKEIRKFLYLLASSKRMEKKTADPDLLPRVHLSEDTAVKVTGMETDDAPPLFNVLIGKRDENFQGTFLRDAGDNQSWLVSEKLAVEPANLAWVDKEILRIDHARIWKIRLAHEGGLVVEIDREKPAGDFVLNTIPKGKELSAHYDIYTVSTAVENMKFANVAKAEALPDPVKTTAHFLTIDGLELEVRIAPGAVKGMHWATVSARFLPEAILESEEAKKLSKTPEEVQKEVAAINARTQGWVYVLDEFPYKLLMKTMEDFTKPIKAPKDDKKAS